MNGSGEGIWEGRDESNTENISVALSYISQKGLNVASIFHNKYDGFQSRIMFFHSFSVVFKLFCWGLRVHAL